MAADTSPISVLCVDDEPGMADLIETYLERNDERLAVTTASSAADGLSFLDEQDFDCIVSDYDMADMDGLLFLEAVRAEWPDLPFILFTGRGSEEIASEAISAGVTDYMQKGPGTDQYEVLARRVTNAVSRYRLQKQAAAKQEHAETILRASPNAIFVSVDDACVYSNPAAIDFLALSEAGDAVGESVSTLLGVDSERFPSPPTDDPFERERLSLPARNRSVEVTTREITWDDTAATIYILRDITEQLEYETRLKHQQSILDSTFEASPSGVIITDEDRNIITYNQQFVDLWGIPESILETGDGRLAVEAVLDRLEDPDSFVKNLDRQHNDPSSETQQNRIELTDGTVLDQYAAPVVSDDGTRYGYVRFYRDITELTQLQQAQKDVFDRMTDAVFAVSPEWEFTFLNEQAARLLQRDAEDLLGANLWEEFPEAASGVVFERYHEAMETGESVTFEVYYEPLETDFEIRAYPSKTGLTVYFRDITETRRTKAELRDGVDALHSLYGIASDSETSFEDKREQLLAVGCEYLGVSDGFVTEITETTQTIVASKSTNDLLQPGESCPLEDSYCRKTISTEEGLLAVENAGRAGWSDDSAYERFELETYIGGRIVVNGDLYGTICFADAESRRREFSEMERTFVELLTRWMAYELERQEHLSQLETTNARLAEFASIVSHDLRNPLSVANGYLELVAQDHDIPELTQIERAHSRMQELIDDILLLARDGTVIGELTAVDLAETSESCWNTVETADATLRIETDRTILADESRLRQLIENLVRNAVEHGGSDVTVTIGDLPDGFFIEDSGVGIPDDRLGSLFEPGYSTEETNTGLGLRIVEQIVDAHGWEIRVTSGTDGGARFEITGVETA